VPDSIILESPDLLTPIKQALEQDRKSQAFDMVSGLMVFLIALPLSVGIALASGAPPSAGLWAAIVGGIIGSITGGSYLTINGPAAGMIVVVLHAIQDLGHGDPGIGFRRALAAFFFAGVLQLVFGKMKLGRLGLAIPGSVIHGMLTAIGIIIITKQLYVALGIQSSGKNTLELLADFPMKGEALNPEVALIAAVGLMIVLAFNTYTGSWKKYVPVPLLVVLSGVGLARLFDFAHLHTIQSHGLTFDVSPKLLLALPDSLASTIISPDFSAIGTGVFWLHTISIALIASIETLLSAAAVDRIDPLQRKSNLDRELISKGICNVILGLIGGLPIIAEMVRSKANVENGAKTQISNFTHGALIFIFVIGAPWLLNNIPLATFAAVLIPVGYALAHPSQFFNTARVGREHFTAFVVSMIVTLGSDLLIGVLAGIAVEALWNFYKGARSATIFSVKTDTKVTAEGLEVAIKNPLTFANLLALHSKIDSHKGYERMILDLSSVKLIDHTAHEHLHKLRHEAKVRGRTIEIKYNDRHIPFSSHPSAGLWQTENTEISSSRTSSNRP